MSNFKFFLFALMLLSSKSFALIITDIITLNNKLSDSHRFMFDLVEQGYNPATDSINLVTLTFDIREIIEDPFEDDATMDDGTREFMMIYDRFMYFRGVFSDMDTGVYSSAMHWVRGEGCHYWEYSDTGEEICVFNPDQDGLFHSFWYVYTDNLWLNYISLEIDVTRQDVDEPSSLFLLSGLLFALMFRFRFRFRKSFSINKY